MSTAIARLQRMNHGSHFRAFSLRGGEAVPSIDPILGVDHAWLSASTFPPHPHAGFSAVSYLFLDSETGINNRDSLGNKNLISPGVCIGPPRVVEWCTWKVNPLDPTRRTLRARELILLRISYYPQA